MAVMLALRAGRRFTLQRHNLFLSLSKRQALVRPEGLGKLKKKFNENDTGASDRPPCNTAPQSSTLPHKPFDLS
jgi:hypothetical protein